MHARVGRTCPLILRLLAVAVILGRSNAIRGQDTGELELLPPMQAADSAAPTNDEILTAPPTLADSEWSWIKPATWFVAPVWQIGAELGINGSAGNAQAFSIVAATNVKHETDTHALDLTINYAKTQSGGVETQHYSLLTSRYDWKLGPKWIVYNKDMLEYNEFKAFDLRLLLSGGLGYHFVKTDLSTLTGRLGAGASREFGGPEDEWVPEGNLGLDFQHQLSAKQKVTLTSDYYPSWDDFQDYRLVTNANWEILLDEVTNLSLKIGALDLYDSTPSGREPNDLNYFVTLVWKR